MDKKIKNLIIILSILLVIILIWGSIGGKEAEKVGVTCDFGLGESLCWKWHTNVIGEIQEGLRDIFENKNP